MIHRRVLIILSLFLLLLTSAFLCSEGNNSNYTIFFWVPRSSDSLKYAQSYAYLNKKLIDNGIEGWSIFENYGAWKNPKDSIEQEYGYFYMISGLNKKQIKTLDTLITKIVKNKFGQKSEFIIVFKTYDIK